jgi:hypothetical protein
MKILIKVVGIFQDGLFEQAGIITETELEEASTLPSSLSTGGSGQEGTGRMPRFLFPVLVMTSIFNF